MGMAITVPRYTVEDLERFPDDGNRYELLDGVLIVTPAPRLAHQRVAVGIAARLWNTVEVPGIGCVAGPGAISAPPFSQLEPDVLVFPARFGSAQKWTDVTEHWLAVEVLSRSSRFYDREYKRDAYFQLGVRQVWLVDIEDRSVDIWHSRVGHEVVRDVIRWQVPASPLEVMIALADLFAGLA